MRGNSELVASHGRHRRYLREVSVTQDGHDIRFDLADLSERSYDVVCVVSTSRVPPLFGLIKIETTGSRYTIYADRDRLQA